VLEPHDDHVRVVTEAGVLQADAAVVTAGAWVAGLVAPLGIEVEVRPTRETTAFFAVEGAVPTFCEWGDPTVYALPSPDDGLKVGEHIAGPTTDPEKEGSVNHISLEKLREWVAARFPTAAATEHHSETCLYTNTPDEHFILERHNRVIVGSPCSGHGFKFAPLIGERLASLASEVF
jgi:sarcosine oxidase